jgi:hypothetical protein
VQLAFAFFILVMITSYTASLASQLVVQREAVGAISSITEAIDQGIPICAPKAVLDTLGRLYPRATFVPSISHQPSPRMLYEGMCSAAIMTQDVIDSMLAGNLKEADCKAVADGDFTEAEGHCKEGFPGRPRNDCEFMRVGDILFSIPIGYPVSDRLIHSVSWAFTRQLLQGSMEEQIKLNEEFFPQSRCDAKEQVEEDGLTIKDTFGAIMVSSIFLAIAMALLLFEMALRTFAPSLYHTAVVRRFSLTSDNTSDNDASTQDLPLRRRRWMRMRLRQREGKETDAEANATAANGRSVHPVRENDAEANATAANEPLWEPVQPILLGSPNNACSKS